MTTAVDEVVALLHEVTGDTTAEIGPATRLDGDLLLDSLELAALAHRLRDSHERVDLLGYVAGLDLEEIIALTVSDVAGLVAASLVAAS
jgi:acyl carrier protein